MSKRTKGNAKHLFKEDIKDGWLRRIPELGDFGNRNIPSLGISGLHIGTDYGANIGEQVIAYDDYEVLSTSGHSDYGKQVFLYFPKINKTGHYAHLNSISVKVGQKGKARDVIGTSGNTGKSQGPHLHFSFGSGKITNTNKSNAWEDFEKYVYPKPSVSSDKVKVKSSATHYATGQAIPSFVKGKEYTVMEKQSDRVLLKEIMSWVKTSDIEVSVSKPKPQSNKRYINIHKGKKYGTYRMGVAPVRANIDQYLRPDNLGGLSYEIVGDTKFGDVFIIETRDFGKRQIFLDKSRASITNKPLYKVYGKQS